MIPQLRTQASPPKVHLLTYSAPVTKKMLPFSGLRYYSTPALPHEHTIPPCLVVELGLFASRLCMGYEECMSLVKYIDDVSASRRSNATTEKTRFILEWTSLRRKGQDIMHTPLGYVCQGRPLGTEHAFFVTRHAADSSVMEPYHTSEAVTEAPGDDEEEEDEYDGGRQYNVQEG
ncbi:hypothetical protein IG631_11197 [Alternaria alternata]|nr:hypothetical protein IG631_11197 [Alternaria alternata]